MIIDLEGLRSQPSNNHSVRLCMQGCIKVGKQIIIPKSLLELLTKLRLDPGLEFRPTLLLIS